MPTLHGSDVVTVPYGEKVLSFDPVEHRYHLGSVELRSVTQYLKDAGYCHPWHGNGDAATFGRYVHEVTAYDDFGTLGEYKIDPRLMVRVEAWRKFKRVEGFEPDMALRERPCFHPVYFYGGTPDAPGLRKEKPCVVEIKSGAKENWHKLQCGGGYTPMLAQHFQQYAKADSLIVYLKDDGDYEIVLASDRCLPALFMSITATINGRSVYGDATGRT